MIYENEFLNDDWIKEFEKKNELYQDFYKDDLYYINLKIIYINKNYEIEKMKNEIFFMSKPNCISREEMIKILKNNEMENEKKYSILSILKYTIDLEEEDITNFLNNTSDFVFLSINKNIDTIKFEKTINMFKDLNDLIIIFNEQSKKIDKSTNNFTKKNFNNYTLLNKRKKTIRKIT